MISMIDSMISFVFAKYIYNLYTSHLQEMFKKQQRMDEALKLENEQLKLENEFLTTSQKNTSDRFPNIVDLLLQIYFFANYNL